jgi:RNA polymerase sigma-70 factor (ECF subfamily)
VKNAQSSTSAAPHDLFAATHWSVVLQARDHSADALAALCANYRAPLLRWLQVRSANHDAEDLVQGFFAHLLKRNFLVNVAPTKGRFRTFLLVSLKHYLRDELAKTSARKRGGGQFIASLQEETDGGGLRHDPAAPGDAPDVEFDKAWADAILANALRRLNTECAQAGHAALYSALEPALFADETASSYREVARNLGMSEGATKVAAHRLRTRLKFLIRAEVLGTIADQETLDDEIRYLVSLFGR